MPYTLNLCNIMSSIFQLKKKEEKWLKKTDLEENEIMIEGASFKRSRG